MGQVVIVGLAERVAALRAEGRVPNVHRLLASPDAWLEVAPAPTGSDQRGPDDEDHEPA